QLLLSRRRIRIHISRSITLASRNGIHASGSGIHASGNRSPLPQTHVISTGAKRSGETPVFCICFPRLHRIAPRSRSPLPQTHVISTGAQRSGETPVFCTCFPRLHRIPPHSRSLPLRLLRLHPRNLISI